MAPLALSARAARFVAAAVTVALLAAGCAHHARGAPKGWPESEWIVDGRTGERSAFDAMIDDLATADVVFVGEDHHNEHHHVAQRRIAEALLARHPDLAIGLEMMQTDAQPIADKWVSGALALDEFRRETNWDRTWGFPLKLYKPILELARDRHVPLVALNAPESVVKQVRELGVDGLPPEVRARLPEMDLSNEAHRTWVKKAMGAHHALNAGRFERAYSIQVLWDETMAETTAKTVSRSTPPRKMLVFAGTGHLIRRMGIPSRVERRVPGVKTRVVLALPIVDDTPSEIRASVEEKDGDWLWITPDASPNG